MKKIILGLSILAIAGATTFTACKKDEVKKETVTTSKSISANSRITSGLITPEELEQILAISEDSSFRALIRIRVFEYNNAILNQYALSTLLETEMTPSKISTYSTLLGYSSTEAYIEAANLCEDYEDDLESKFQFSSLRNDLIIEATALTPTVIPIPSYVGGKSSFCQKTYENECLSILGSSLAMHAGCAAIDAILIGTICHAGVLAWGIAERNKALLALEACH